MAWKKCVVAIGRKEVSGYQRGNEISLAPEMLKDAKSTITVDGKNYPILSSELDGRGETLIITLELPIGSQQKKVDPDGESNESKDTTATR
tara:strand:- start:242 stop:514 length:273 start_codon:yes stop_codon:yes gene_type:complete